MNQEYESGTMGRRSIAIRRYDGSELKRCGAVIFSAPPNEDAIPGEPPYVYIPSVEKAATLCNAELSIGSDFRINHVSEGFLNVTGFFAEELVGEELGELLPETMTLVQHTRSLINRFGSMPKDTFFVVLIAAPELPKIPIKADRTKQHPCFFSYSRSGSQAHAARIVRFLKARGFDVWFDLEEINYGANFEAKLYEGVAQSERFCFPLCRDYLESKYCRVELDAAVTYHKPILPIIQEMDQGLIAEFHAAYPSLEKINWVEFVPGKDSASRAINSIEAFVAADGTFHAEATRRLVEAVQWERNNKPRSLLLQPEGAALGEAWLTTNALKEANIAKLVREHIHQSSGVSKKRRRQAQVSVVIALIASILGFGISAILYRRSVVAAKELAVALSLAEIKGLLAEGNYAVSQRNVAPCSSLKTAIDSLESAEVLRAAQDGLSIDDEEGEALAETIRTTIGYLREDLAQVLGEGSGANEPNLIALANTELRERKQLGECLE